MKKEETEKELGLRPNWNVGMMEHWNIGFWGIDGMGYWENQVEKPRKKLKIRV